jgi:hypothetical protein
LTSFSIVLSLSHKVDLMGILTAYFDDSGTADENRVAVVAGYVSSVTEWERFSTEWRCALDEEDVKVMRRSDLENFQGEFSEHRGWNANRRSAFVRRLQEIIKRLTRTAVGTALIKADFETVMPDSIKKWFGGAYGWCAHECIVHVSKWADRCDHADPIDWVFEAGTRGEGRIAEMFAQLRANPAWCAKYRIGNLAFSDKNTVPLQSADVLAYEVFKQVENQILDQGNRPVRRSLQYLHRQDEGPYLKYWDETRLRDWLSKWEEQQRALGVTGRE